MNFKACGTTAAIGSNAQTGSSLIEVLISLTVLAFGILGVLGMQAKSVQFNQSAGVYSHAVHLAGDIAERIRSNKNAANNYVVASAGAPTQPPTPNCKANATPCTPAQMASWDLFSWRTQIEKNLPYGLSEITLVNFNARQYLNVELSFDDSRSDEAQPTAVQTGRKSYQLMVEI